MNVGDFREINGKSYKVTGISKDFPLSNRIIYSHGYLAGYQNQGIRVKYIYMKSSKK